MRYYWNTALRLLELLHQNRFEGLFEPFVVFEKGIAHAFLDFVSQSDKFLSSHFFRIFHKYSKDSPLYKTFAAK